jgi:hypothetical protein
MTYSQWKKKLKNNSEGELVFPGINVPISQVGKLVWDCTEREKITITYLQLSEQDIIYAFRYFMESNQLQFKRD